MGRMARGVLPALVVALVAGSCVERKDTVPRPERPKVQDLGGQDAQREPIRDTAPQPRHTVVESRGACAPPADGVRNLGACCNDKPCHGECVVEPESPQVQCSCYGMRGGCPEGEVCCKRFGRCTKLVDCDWVP